MMKNYQYYSNSRTTARAFKRNLGFELFCHRHHYKIAFKEVCDATQIPSKILSNLELGTGNFCWGCLDRLLAFYHKKIQVTLIDD